MNFDFLDGSFFDGLLNSLWLIPAGFLLAVIIFLVALPIRYFFCWILGR